VKRHWLNIAIVSFLLTVANVVRAEDFVLIVIPSGDNIDYSSFENRLRAELAAAGYATITATLPAPIDSAALPAQASRFSTNICVSLSVSDRIVVGFVSVADPASARSVIRPVPGYPIGEQAPSVFAVRATDVLHGVLLELNYTPKLSQKLPQAVPERPVVTASRQAAPTRSTLPPVVSPRRYTKPEPGREPGASAGRWGVSLDVAFNGGGRAIPTAPGAEVGVFWQERYWGLSAEGSAYLPAVVNVGSSSIKITQWLVGADFQLFQPLGSAFRVFESLGGGAYGVSLSGESPIEAIERNRSDVLAYLGAGSGLVSDFNERTALALRLRVLAPLSVADVIVRDPSGERTVAQLRFPIVLGDLGLRVTF